jgi:hypothetical protein
MENEMFDVVAYFLSPEQIRATVVIMEVLSAVLIGPLLAFAVTEGAGIRCFFALVRLVQRVVLVLFSISLMYNAMGIVVSGITPSGSAVLIIFCIFASTSLSAVRHVQAPTVPDAMTWRDFWKNLNGGIRPPARPRR